MNKKQMMKLSPLVGAVVLALSAPLAVATTITPPAAGTLPGAFYTNQSSGAVTYASTATNAASIAVPAGATVLQFGGSSAGVSNSVTAPSGIMTAAGFNIGSGASLTVESTAAAGSPIADVLINDITGNPSQVYGTLQAVSSATADGPTTFIANANGVIIGNGASLKLPNGGGIIGEAQNPVYFASSGGEVASGTGTGPVSLMSTVNIAAGGYLLVAGNGNVNIGDVSVGSASFTALTTIVAGDAFTMTGNTSTAALPPSVTTGTAGAINSTANVIFNGTASSNLNSLPLSVYDTGGVSIPNGAYADLANATFTNGTSSTFTNDGNTTLGSGISAGSILNNGVLSGTPSTTTPTGFNLVATSTGGSVVNDGVINVLSAGTLSLMASSSTGTVTNNGVINFYASNAPLTANSFNSSAGGTSNLTQTNPNYLDVSAQNVNMYGVVNQATASSGSGVTPTALYLNATGGINAIAGASIAASLTSGVLNYGTTLVTVSDTTNSDLLQGDAVRILSGRFANRNIFDQGHNGELNVNVGSGAVGNYGYNLSIFPGAIIQAWHLNVNNDSAPGVPTTTYGDNINLDGTIQSNNAVVNADNINAASYVAGGPNGSNGFRIMANSIPGATNTPPTDGSLLLNVAGNVNNPQGAAAAGQPASAFQYNGVPVTVFGGDGTSYISVMPTNTANAPQMVNLLVNGSAILGNSGVSNAASSFVPGGSIVPASSYPNSHLVVSATGNLTFGPYISSYWQSGLTYNGSTTTGYAPATSTTAAGTYQPAGQPTTAYNGSYYWPGLMVFSNITSAADPTSVGLGTMTLDAPLSNLLPTNVSGNGGIFFNTNGLIAGLSSMNYVLTNSNSWINFPAGSQGSLIAAQYSSNNAANMYFYGATTNANASGLLTSQVLPASDIVSR